MPAKDKKKMLDELEGMLLPFKEKTTVIRRRKGSYLLNNGITEIRSKAGIFTMVSAAKDYDVSEVVEVPVNHRRRMSQLLEEAKDMAEAEQKLGEYVARFANPSNFISSSSN